MDGIIIFCANLYIRVFQKGNIAERKIVKIQSNTYLYKYQYKKQERTNLTYEYDTVSFSASYAQKRNSQRIAALLGAMFITITGSVSIATRLDNRGNSTPSYSLTEPETEKEIEEKEPKEISAKEILTTEPEVKKQYDKIIDALDSYSKHLGEPALPIIIEKVNEIGNNKVEVIDVLKTLWIESNGRIYDDSGEILKSGADAYGAFQVTKDTQDYLNNYFKVNLDVENPYDNLDACIYNLRFLHEKRSKDMEEGKQLPTGDNLKKAIAWSYHDGAWATKISYYGQDYINKYTELSLIDQYPQVIEYIINSGE